MTRVAFTSGRWECATRPGCASGLVALALFGAACTPDDSGTVPGGVRGEAVERITVGDTTIVRNHDPVGAWEDTLTLEPHLLIGALEGPPELLFGDIRAVVGGPEGSVLVLDRQAAELREFTSSGDFIRSIGRRGSGPGEFERPEFVRVDPAGRILVLDGVRRMTVFDSEGTLLDTWTPQDMYTAHYFTVDVAGNTYIQIRLPNRPEDEVEPGESAAIRLAYVRYDPEGRPSDTLPPGGWLLDPPGQRRIQVSSMSHALDNFTPLGVALVHPSGGIVSGDPETYSVSLGPPPGGSGVLRMERLVEPAAFTSGEWAEWREYLDLRRASLEEAMAGQPADVRASAPSPPYFPESPVKPYFRWIYLGEAGRIWVDRRTVAEQRPLPEGETEPRPPITWIEPVHFDVFEPDGTFLGTVVVPDGYSIQTIRGDTIWGAYHDELQVPYAFRATLVPMTRADRIVRTMPGGFSSPQSHRSSARRAGPVGPVHGEGQFALGTRD